MDEAARAQRLLQRLVNATNKRLHKGMPSIYASLLRKPTNYCSHEFEQWSVSHIHNIFVWRFEKRYSAQPTMEDTIVTNPSYSHLSSTTHTALPFDYQYRPRIMDHFPYYFFIAGTECKANTASSTWDWYTAADDEDDLRRVVRDTDGTPLVQTIAFAILVGI